MESTLALKLSDFAGRVGFFLGYGRGADNDDTAWTTRQLADINDCLKSGLRSFYFPQVMEASGATYDWSFLRPIVSLTLSEGESTLALPDDCGSIQGQITVSTATGSTVCPLTLSGEGTVRNSYARFPDDTGAPGIASIQPIKGTEATKGQRFRLYIYPLADQDYTLQFAYNILPDFLTISHPYPYGGMAHAETLLEACLAAAESIVDDTQSVHKALFNERLAASMGADRRLKPTFLGYNGDRSDGPSFDSRQMRYTGELVTFDGTQF